MKLRTPSGRGAALGTLVHDQIERYLAEGKPLDFAIKDAYGAYPAEIAQVGLQHLPEPMSPGLSVEGYFKFEVPECPGAIFRGFKDYTVEPEYREDGHPHVGDHKTCGNWAYALTADQLRGDIQAIIYAKHEILTHPDAQAVTLQWGYLGTKKPYRAKPVRCTLTRADVDLAFAEIVCGTRELLTTLGSKKQPLELPFNRDECPKYSRDGCPFQGTCNLGPEERRILRMPTKTTEDLLTRIKGRQAKATGVPAAELEAAPAKGLSPIQAKLAAARAAQAAGGPKESEASATLPVTPAAQSTAYYAPGCEPVAPTEIPAVFAPPPMPKSDQPINCPEDFQPPPTSDAARIAAEAATLATIIPPKEKPAKAPKAAKATADVLSGVDPALITRFLTSASEYYEFVLREDSKAVKS